LGAGDPDGFLLSKLLVHPVYLFVLSIATGKMETTSVPADFQRNDGQVMTHTFRLALLCLSLAIGVLVTHWRLKPDQKVQSARYANPPASILICGIKDHPCVSYAISYHEATGKYGDGPSEGFTNYEAKTITIATGKDRVENVQALEHEVYHAALWERGYKDNETWALHDWIYFSEGPFSMVLHDNPALVQYILNGY
jgi:hypothetical protein